jgi:hypothetical protein
MQNVLCNYICMYVQDSVNYFVTVVRVRMSITQLKLRMYGYCTLTLKKLNQYKHALEQKIGAKN